MSEELKPCPCCGGEAAILRSENKNCESIACVSCGLVMSGYIAGSSQYDRWNRRQPEAKPLTVERLAEILSTNPLYYTEAGHLHFKKSAESLFPAINAAMSSVQQKPQPLVVEQVGWKWIEGQSVDDYTCGYQPYDAKGADWFVAHKWEPVYILRTDIPRNLTRDEIREEMRKVLLGHKLGTELYQMHGSVVDLMAEKVVAAVPRTPSREAVRELLLSWERQETLIIEDAIDAIMALWGKV